MSRALIVHLAGPQMTVQDLGRPGLLAVGLSRGGAADRMALLEAAALLGQPPGRAAIEMAGAGGTFEAEGDLRIALTGAPMRATIGSRPVAWNASHALAAGERLTIGPAIRGIYGYLSVAGGLDVPEILGSRSVHLVAGIGSRLTKRDRLPVGTDPDPGAAPTRLEAEDRFAGGTIRIVPGAQTEMFSQAMRTRFEATEFTRDARGNRQGVRLAFDGDPFATEAGRTILSEVIVPGDIQMTGEGTPFVLLPECQTTGGYPRIGSVVPNDMARVAQAAPGTGLRFTFVTHEAAAADFLSETRILADLRRRREPLVRDPREVADLLSYQLISGATSGDDHEPWEASA